MERLIAKMGINFKNGPTPYRGAVPNPAKRRRHAFSALAFLAVLAVGLLFLLPGGLLQAQSAEQFIDYAENGDGPVATFTASDPEGAMPVAWSVTTQAVADANVVDADIADNALFEIDQNGVLRFKDSPNYEDPADDGTGNEYRVTVQVSDGNQIAYFEVHVNVTDKEETGKVTWIVGPDGSATEGTDIGLQQFQPGAQLFASVTDPDGGAAATGWKWYRGSTRITTADADDNTYTVVSADVGNRIRVEATFTDTNGGAAETRSFTSPHPVQAFRRPEDNTAPVFSPTGVTRRVEENSTGNVGGPVTATDADGDRLTYTISGDDSTFDHDNSGATPNIDRFKIDPATGQLMAAVKLNYETTASYTVTVTATDSSGIATAIPATVTINVTDIDEKPTFATTSTAAGVLNAAGVVSGHMEGRTVIDTDADPADDSSTEAATLVASDPDGKKVTLSLMGNDAGSFELADDADTGNAVSQELSFMEKPDFEMPGDRNRDNVYEVTVRASDGTMHADRALIIKVINNPGEGGKVTLSPEDAVVGVELKATLAHMEGGVAASGQITNPMWQWQRAAVPVGTGDTCADVEETDWAAIDNANAKKDTYTPVSADLSTASPPAGCLSAMVTYTYQFAPTDPATMARSEGTAVLVSQANQPPKFKEGTRTFRVVMEDVEANTADNPAGQTDVVTDNVGSEIEATDANGDMVTYTLSGADASLFRIRSDDGQLEVKGELDHETDTSHTVTVTANDGSGASNDSARITVTIYVTDVDEAPTIKDRADSTAQGERTIPYTENGDEPVARFMASDPEDATPGYWMLAPAEVVVGGTTVVAVTDIEDRALFEIDQNGVLRFKDSPNYEDPADDGTGNEYRVTVQVSDGNQIAYFKVTVNVTDKEETGKVTWIVGPDGSATEGTDIGLQQFQPGAQLFASVTDPDGGAAATGWKWYRGSTRITTADADDNTYTVVSADVGNRIRVEATFTDTNGGAAETRSFTSPHPVRAFRQTTDNDPPVFSPTGVTRRVEENSTGNVGGPVTATDADGDRLTYTISGDDSTFDHDNSGATPNIDRFKIDPATGQLMAAVKLNYETTASYTVTVTATDSSGIATAIPATVTINVTDIDEKPTFATTSTAAGVLNAAGVVSGHMEGRTVIDTDADPADDSSTEAATLVASDPDGKKVTLSLMGNDCGFVRARRRCGHWKRRQPRNSPSWRSRTLRCLGTGIGTTCTK